MFYTVHQVCLVGCIRICRYNFILLYIGITVLNHNGIEKCLADGKPNLSCEGLIQLFKVLWSPVGSNQREIEESVILGWTEYINGLKDIAHGQLIMKQIGKLKSSYSVYIINPHSCSFYIF